MNITNIAKLENQKSGQIKNQKSSDAMGCHWVKIGSNVEMREMAKHKDTY